MLIMTSMNVTWGIGGMFNRVGLDTNLINDAINFSESFTLANYHGRVIPNSLRIFATSG